jgi:hypothetical protein
MWSLHKFCNLIKAIDRHAFPDMYVVSRALSSCLHSNAVYLCVYMGM